MRILPESVEIVMKTKPVLAQRHVSEISLPTIHKNRMRTKFSKTTISTGVAPWRRVGRINKEKIILPNFLILGIFLVLLFLAFSFEFKNEFEVAIKQNKSILNNVNLELALFLIKTIKLSLER